jgi:DNA-binding CsgD family transcriptional regulator
MKKIAILMPLVLMLSSCMEEKQQQENDGFDITGAWVLVSMTDSAGQVHPMDMGAYTRCKIFDPDSMYYSMQLYSVGGETMIRPHELARYSLHVSPDDTTYIENGRLTTFEIIDDSTMTTVWDGYVETMRRAKTMSESRMEEIRNIFRSKKDDNGEVLREYVLSTSERQLKNTISTYHYLFMTMVLLMLFIICCAIHVLRRKREVERNLSAIKEELMQRPAILSDALKQVEDGFFQSDYYQALRPRITAGENISEDEWQEMERQMDVVFSGFCRKLRSLHHFSDIEFRVCLLTKLRASNKEIAAVINRAPESVSSIRNRLHKKVLGSHGGAKEWDEFVLSL